MISDISKYKNYIETYKPILTVFVVTYNRAEYLKLTLQSILEQTYKDFCLVVLDNASTDDTKNIIDNIKDKRLIYLAHKKNIDAPNNMNTAINMALTQYFIIFHDDDLMMPQFIEKELDVIQKYDFDILSCFAKHIDEYGNIQEYYRKTNNKPLSFTGSEYFKSFLNASPNTIYCPSVIYKNDFIKTHKLFFDYEKAGLACDAYLFFEIERNYGKIGIYPQELFFYRHHSQQGSNINKSTIQIKLFHCLCNDIYYSKLLNTYKKQSLKFIFLVLVEILLSYNIKNDKPKLLSILDELANINSRFLKNKSLLLLLKLSKVFPSTIGKFIFYLKKIFQIYKKHKYA